MSKLRFEIQCHKISYRGIWSNQPFDRALFWSQCKAPKSQKVLNCKGFEGTEIIVGLELYSCTLPNAFHRKDLTVFNAQKKRQYDIIYRYAAVGITVYMYICIGNVINRQLCFPIYTFHLDTVKRPMHCFIATYE